MLVNVCIGSSCHLKGSYEIINTLKNLVSEHKLEDKVELAAAFCLGKCLNGVTVKIDGELVLGVSPENVNEIFNERILKVISLKGAGISE
jgi:NADH:ubiquinone oxidoreductase subunit E